MRQEKKVIERITLKRYEVRMLIGNILNPDIEGYSYYLNSFDSLSEAKTYLATFKRNFTIKTFNDIVTSKFYNSENLYISEFEILDGNLVMNNQVYKEEF